MDTQLYPLDNQMTVRGVLLDIHSKYCWPSFVPVVGRITKISVCVAVVAFVVAYVASQ